MKLVIIRKKVKNINIRIKNDGTVQVSAHPSVPKERIMSLLEEKKDFIENALRKVEEERNRRNNSAGEVKDGGYLRYYGKERRLCVMKGRGSILCDEENIYLYVNDPTDSEKIKKRFFEERKAYALKVFTEICREIFPYFEKRGVSFPNISTRIMKTRWGSCAYLKGKICLNLKLDEAPYRIIRSVIAHEMCHFLHHDHSAAFYKELENVIPDYRELKRELESVYGI
ncbi:MAG: M48 family metallopeptidase [Ruminococcaceae bacterium]|nr:M48 family metallopeptidase [Oscillospiraceae bacterium]